MRTPRRHAFSLIEVLVVVAVIALLIAILLPVLAKARESANIAVCNTNLRSLMQAQIAYTLDSDGYYTVSTEWVWSKDKYPDGSKPVGSEHMDPTVEKNITQGTLWPYHGELEAFFCPVAATKLPRQGWWKNPQFIRSYVQNGEAGEAAELEWHNKGWTEEEQVETVLRPADFAFFAEENTYSIAGWNTHHNNGMNDALFRLQPFDYDQFGSFHKTGTQLGEPNADGYYDPADELNSGVSYAAMADGHVEEVNYKGKISGGPWNGVSWSRMWCKDAIPVQRY